MSTINARSFSTPRNINLKGQGSTRGGILLFEGTNTTNPISTTDNGLYVNASNELVYVSQSTSTILGAAGGGSSQPSFDSLYNNDQTMAIGGVTFTIDRTAGNGDVLTLTNTGAGTVDVLQISNVGTGKDIIGTSSTWSFSKAGDQVANMAVFAGDAGSDSLTLTAGDVLISDGSIALTDADNAASLTITNDTATTASVVVLAGSGAFTGSTTTSWMTITPSGLTTGTAVYLPVAALTTGKAVHVVANAVTDGIVVHIASSVAGTTMTSTGRLFNVDHTGTATASGVLSEFNSAAADETTIVRVNASAALAAGVVLDLSAAALTTGKVLDMSNLDAITTGKAIHIDATGVTHTDGILVHIDSAGTVLTATGRLFLSDHTGATTTSGVLNEFKTAATDETVVVQVTTAAMISGVALKIDGTTGMTTGSLVRVASSTAGALATNGVVSFTATGAAV